MGADWIKPLPDAPNTLVGGSIKPEECSLIFAFNQISMPDYKSLILLEEWDNNIVRTGNNPLPVKRIVINAHDRVIRTTETQKLIPINNLTDDIPAKVLERRLEDLRIAVEAGTLDLSIGNTIANSFNDVTPMSELDEDELLNLGTRLLEFIDVDTANA